MRIWEFEMKHKKLLAVVTASMLVAFVSALPSTAQDDKAAEGENEMLAVLESYNGAFVGDLKTLPQFLTQDAVRHHLRGPDMETGELVEQVGIDEIAAFATSFQESYPGVTINVTHSVERDNYIWTALVTTELPETDGAVISVNLMARFSGGKIAEIWVAQDELAMLSLLKALPVAE